MSKTVVLPGNWSALPVGRAPIDEGIWNVVIDEANFQDDGRVRIAYSVLDEGPFSGWTLGETFSLDVDYSAAMFKELLCLLGIPQDGPVNLAQIERRTLRVVVRHREDPDTKQRFANVVRHLPSK